MQTILAALVKYLSEISLAEAHIIPWSCPVVSFGDSSSAVVATLGLNPSNREFLDERGNELDGPLRRFHTLSSLGLDDWADADARHLQLILDSCRTYFLRNPYDTWFRRLDHIISGTDASYYGFPNTACHLDLIPYATAEKWTALDYAGQSALLTRASETLALLIRDSPIRVLVLNGNAVVTKFQELCDNRLHKQLMDEWSLPRRSTSNVAGFAYKGVVHEISGVELDRPLLVLGFNHNIQSSFGVTSEVMDAIHRWISGAADEVI